MAGLGAQTQSSHLLVQNLRMLQPSSTGLISCFGPLILSSAVPTCAALSNRLTESVLPHLRTLFFTSTSTITRSYPFSSRRFSSSSLNFPKSNCYAADSLAGLYEEVDEDFSDESDIEESDEEIELEKSEADTNEKSGEVAKVALNRFEVPSLTVKEKKELASYARSLGEKLKAQSIGKSGVTVNVAASFVETLEPNELLKIKIHRTCPGELDEVLQQLEQATGSVVVSKIGRTVIIYRPSVTKLKAEAKKREARKLYVKRQPTLKSASLDRVRASRFAQGRRRGSRRLSPKR